MNKINTRKALNPAYRKHKPLRKDVNNFTDELLSCLETIKLSEERDEHEEHFKEPIKTFFKNTFYKDNYINTKDRIDLAVYTGKDANSDVGVLFEVKRPSNKAEFLSPTNLNRKALHELLLYYLRERIDNDNNNIKHLIATNGNEWFLFKGDDFYTYFYKNKALLKEYNDFRDAKKDSSKNELFYNEIAKKHIAKVEKDLPFIHLDFTKKNPKDYSDANVNTLYKIFSDVHILGNSFGNDSNELNKTFYNELLHIIGLEEVKVKGKKIIHRKSEDKRDYASILENAIFVIEDRDYLPNIKSIESGTDKAFNSGLELTLTWVNRILFLKLLESQLLSYHNGAKEYHFLNSDFIKGYDDLNDLFFSALAKKENERHPKYKDRFKHIPYLNSSLFERNTLENEAFEISALNDDELEIYSQTVLKDPKGKRIKGKLSTLNYLFQFLDAYNFATDGTEGIEDGHETKTLINASVLGLIFEKINGYKEGSFYTPAYITMYMSKETLRRAIVQKFKEQENGQIETFEDLQDYTGKFFKKDDLLRFNKIVNSIKIIDPAVGSGHFLVSALNELISIKNELRILIDSEGKPLQSEILIENDELYITDKFGHLLDYKPDDKISGNIQKTLFHEKQNLIENCLFGVDINPNSVKICRLRLWIELLKNAYYTEDNQLQTLPNIDINIKAGNSLISRFDLQDDLKSAFKGTDAKYKFADYKNAVAEYKNTNNKKRKHEILEIIEDVKSNFKSTLDKKFIEDVQKAEATYNNEKQRLENLKAFGESIKKTEKDNLKKLKLKLEKVLTEKGEIVNNKIYYNAFEWRFEFPEVLDSKGNYIGFDVVIGNPPYISHDKITEKKYLKSNFSVFEPFTDIYSYFFEKGLKILSKTGKISFITSNSFLKAEYGKPLRKYIIESTSILSIINIDDAQIFQEATVNTCITLFDKSKTKENSYIVNAKYNLKEIFEIFLLENYFYYSQNDFSAQSWTLLKPEILKIGKKIKGNYKTLSDYNTQINLGIATGSNNVFLLDKEQYTEMFSKDKKNKNILKPIIRGRDIQRYYYKIPDIKLILSKNGVDVKTDYPTIYKYFKKAGDVFKNRGAKGKHWTNLRACSFFDDFKKEKIVWIELSDTNKFALCDEEVYLLNSAYFLIPPPELESKYLLSILNSVLIKFFIKLSANTSGVGTTRWINVYVKEFPIPEISKEAQQPFINKVNQILKLKKEDPKADTSKLENEIDKMVYELYELTEEEILIVEKSVK